MSTEVKLPELGENITSGDLVKILVKVGDAIQKDQAIVELETDKATIEVPSTLAGTVKEVLVKEGQKLTVGQAILSLEDGAGAKAEAAPEKAEAPAKAEPPKSEAENTAASSAATPAAPKSAAPAAADAAPQTASAETSKVAAPAKPQEPAPTPAPAASPRPSGGRSPADVPAAPSVRQMAREIGVDITEVEGSGPGGRITQQDVKRHARERNRAATAVPVAGAAAAMPLPDFSKWGEVAREPMSAIRRATARQMGYAWAIPHVTQNDKADITNLDKLRERFAKRAEAAGGKLTMTAIALKIVASALKAFPKFGASLDLAREEVVLKKYVHIGVAVDTDRGLLVPVIRDVDTKNIIEISVELAKIAENARNKKLALADMEGGIFTITNIGGIGGTFFSPIINAPQVAILGMARAQFEPVYANEKFEARLMLPLSLSYDHRIIDGAEAARFLRWLADAFEQPFLLALEG